MAADPITVLVTGFGPFPGCAANPTSDLARWIDAGHLRAPEGARLVARTLETSWSAVRDFADGPLKKLAPGIALHFGLSARARGFRVETIARNTASISADCKGETCGRQWLIRGASPALRTTLNARQMAIALRRRGLPATTSHDAGSYLCNMLIYLSLHEAERAEKSSMRGFIHIPPVRPGIFTQEDLLSGVDILVRACVSRFRHAEVMRRHANCC